MALFGNSLFNINFIEKVVWNAFCLWISIFYKITFWGLSALEWWFFVIKTFKIIGSSKEFWSILALFRKPLFNINFIEKSCLKRLLPMNQQFLDNHVLRTFCSRMTIFLIKTSKIIGLSKEFLSILALFGNPLFNINFIEKSCLKRFLPMNQQFLENHVLRTFCSRMTIFLMKTSKIIGLSKEFW